MSDYYDLGNYSRKITTASDEAQRWFDRGLVWCYGYNHEESIACFKRALDTDPAAAMAWWGIAYASGCNYNKPWEAFDDADAISSARDAFEATENAKRLAASATPAEIALIDALSARYPQATPGDDMEAWNDAYADAMRKVHRQFGDDLDVSALFAEALMNRTPWALWDLSTGKIADGADTAEAIEVLEAAMARNGGERHPGLLHMYIHLMEMSPHPQKRIESLQTSLRGPGTGLPDTFSICRPISIFCAVTIENAGQTGTTAGMAADRKYLAMAGAENSSSIRFYRCHNYHFKIVCGAMFLGQRQPTLRSQPHGN